MFVFDGGAPALKRMTIMGRKSRREGRREDAVRTAGKLFAVQMKRRGEEEEEKRKKDRERQSKGLSVRPEEDEDAIQDGDDLVYVGEMGMSAQERQKTRKFFKKDAYHLPDLNNGIEGMGQPNDPRIMSVEELEEYARQFNNGEDINLYDFSKIDFNGEFFSSLPAGDRYNILNAARLRSRLRMGLSKEQLEAMFPDRMAFSRFQIDRVRERNELTQRLMNLNGMNEDLWGVGGGRIAGERGREYVLVKNEGVEGGWALGVVSTDKGVGERNKPIDVDALHLPVKEDTEEEEDEFEDVPVEGLNRLPKIRPDTVGGDEGLWEDYPETGVRSRADRTPSEDFDTLFIDEGQNGGPSINKELIFDDEEDDLSRAIALSMQKENSPPPEKGETEEEAHIRRAIALSLQKNHHQESEAEDDFDDFEDVPMPHYEQRAVEAPKPITSASGKMVAHMVNNRANAAIPKRKPVTVDVESDSDSDLDLAAALAKARRQKAPDRRGQPPLVPLNQKNPFHGPLPFESLPFKITSSRKPILRPENLVVDMEDEDEEMEGGFEKVVEQEKAKPLPPWLLGNGDIRSDVQEQQKRDLEVDAEDHEQALEEERLYRKNHAPIQIDSEDEDNDSDVEIVDAPAPKQGAPEMMAEFTRQESVPEITFDSPLNEPAVETMDELAENVRAMPPVSEIPNNRNPPADSETEKGVVSDEEVDWSESDYGETAIKPAKVNSSSSNIDQISKPSSLTPKDIEVSSPKEVASPPTGRRGESPLFADNDAGIGQQSYNDEQFAAQAEEEPPGEFDDFSDPEDEELLAQLAIEAEEHARFASTLNNKSELENQASYEAELKALRSQQQKDRRDADEVSHIMITECQALLRLFGIPYITAPMEAEAQCAELVNLGLVDGVVTDDCDIFLFGGTRVYKNMFNSNKFVECYLSSDIEKELSISRDQLIGLAHLLGSDYTEGLPGVGPVTALEILSEFPASHQGLEEFSEWWKGTQLNGQKPALEATTFRKKFKRSQGTKLFLPPGFPSPAVTEAYWKPDVDSTPEPFQWGVPDLEQLREFLMATIGWTQERTDEVLVPVIRDMNQREKEGTQANITQFFEGAVGAGAVGAAGRNKAVSSKRMKDAVGKLKAKKQSAAGLGGTFAEKAVEWVEKEKLRGEKAKAKAKGRKRAAAAILDEGEDDEEDADDESVGEQTDGTHASTEGGKGKEKKVVAKRKRTKV